MIQVKKNLLNSLIISLSLFSLNTYAEIELELGEGVSLLAVNGEEFESSSLFSGNSFARLPNGKNQILVNYTAEIKPGDDSELEVTKPSVILFNTQASKVNLSAPRIKSANDVDKFEKKLNWKLTDNQGNQIPFQANLLIKKGMQLSRDYEDELKEFNLSNANAALPKFTITKPKELRKAPETKTTQVKENNMAMEMLIYWYNQADGKTRRSFKELINK